jgi:hypothetical protein
MMGYEANNALYLLINAHAWTASLVAAHPKGAALYFFIDQMSRLARLIMRDTCGTPSEPSSETDVAMEGEQSQTP